MEAFKISPCLPQESAIRDFTSLLLWQQVAEGKGSIESIEKCFAKLLMELSFSPPSREVEKACIRSYSQSSKKVAFVHEGGWESIQEFVHFRRISHPFETGGEWFIYVTLLVDGVEYTQPFEKALAHALHSFQAPAVIRGTIRENELIRVGNRIALPLGSDFKYSAHKLDLHDASIFKQLIRLAHLPDRDLFSDQDLKVIFDGYQRIRRKA